MKLKPEAKRSYAIKYLQNPEVQENIVHGTYRNLYNQQKEALVKSGMKEEDAVGEAMVKVVESYMPSYSDKGRTSGGTVINNYMGTDSKTQTPIDSVPFKVRMNFSTDDGGKSVSNVDVSTGKYFGLSLGEKTSMPSTVMRPIDGSLPNKETAVIDVKQGGLTSIPMVGKGSKIKFYDKESGKNVILKSGDVIFIEQ